MKLERFKEKNHKMIGVVLFTIICILLIGSVILYKTFASFEVNHNFNIINGTIQEMGDLEFAFYVDDGIVRESPSESEKENYIFDEENSSCTNGAKVYWDYEIWAPTVLNLKDTKTKCYIKFKKEYSEPILNGAVPQIEGNLTPVTIDEKGIVRKADIKNKWYSYESQQWANAVITKNSYELLGSNVHGEAKLEDGYVHLDGIDDYIDLGLDGYNFGNQITLAIKANFNDVTKYQEFFGNPEAGGGELVLSNNHIINNLYIEDTSDYQRFSSDEEIVPNNDYTIIVTYDGSTIKMWINGKKQTIEVSVAGNIKISKVPFFIGAGPNANGKHANFSNLNVKQAAIFNRAIDESEVTNISDNFKITNGDKLLKYVDFTNKEYEANEVISEDNIESYFVWIPRYRYELWNGEEETNKFTSVETLGIIEGVTNDPRFNGQQEIHIEFENKHTTISEGTKKNQYLTHPAFTSFNSNGMWVGKFETGYKGAITTSEAEVNTKDSSKVIIKPDVYSWRFIQVANAFYTSKEYQEELDSHMMKNTEWGAVAYLTNSKYGRCPNGSCEEVRINNFSSHITGSSSVNEPTCGVAEESQECNQHGTDSSIVNRYDNSLSTASSTTGNYYGIFDMSGGAWEYVMGVMKNANNELIDNYSGFDEFPEEKYYDSYAYSVTNQNFNRGKLGDATKELGPFYKITNQTTSQIGSWYVDQARFLSADQIWFARGGFFNSGVISGIFSFSDAYGSAAYGHGFRIVLAP